MAGYARLLPLLAAVLTCTGCSRKDSDTIRIGVIAELTGDMPAVGASCRNAALLAADEANAQGGLKVGAKKYKI